MSEGAIVGCVFAGAFGLVGIGIILACILDYRRDVRAFEHDYEQAAIPSEMRMAWKKRR